MANSFEQYVKDYYNYAIEQLSHFSTYNGAVGYAPSTTKYDEYFEELEEPIVGEIPVKVKDGSPLEAYLFFMYYFGHKYLGLTVLKSNEELQDLFSHNVFYKSVIDNDLMINLDLER